MSAPNPDALDLIYRKVSLRVLSFLFICYVVAFLDRINIGFAQLQMKQDLAFSDAVYGLGAGIFFVGYFAFEVPSNLLLARIGARRTFTRIMVCWGLVSAGMAWVHAPWMFYTLRFLLGVFEAGFFPGLILYLTYWYPSRRRATVTAWMFVAVAFAGTLGGVVSGWIMKDMAGVHGLAGWQWMFVIEGLPATVLGLITYFYLTDGPRHARWLSDAEQRLLQADLDADRTAKAGHASHSFRAALRHARVYLLAAVYFTLTAGTMAISFWMPALIRAFGVADVLQVGLYSAIPYGLSAIGIVLISRHSDRHMERRRHYAFCAIGGGMALALLAQPAPSLAALIALLSVATILTNAALPVFWSIPPSYLSGTGAAGGIALISSLGQVGSFVSPTLIGWVKTHTGRLDNGLYAIGGLLVAGGVLLLLGMREPGVHAPRTASVASNG